MIDSPASSSSSSSSSSLFQKALQLKKENDDIMDDDEDVETDNSTGAFNDEFSDSPGFWDEVISAEESHVQGKGKQVFKKETIIEEQMESLSVSAVPTINNTVTTTTTTTTTTTLSPSSSASPLPPSTASTTSIKLSTPVPTKRKHVGEDVFVETAVKEWQAPRIKAWEGRYIVSLKKQNEL